LLVSRGETFVTKQISVVLSANCLLARIKDLRWSERMGSEASLYSWLLLRTISDGLHERGTRTSIDCQYVSGQTYLPHRPSYSNSAEALKDNLYYIFRGSCCL
jgi:hypothetical protein